MAMTRALWIAIAIGLPAIGHAQTPGAPGAQPLFEPPHAIGSTDVAFPDGAPPLAAPLAVTVKLHVDDTGAVETVDLVTPPQPVFDDAVIAAARAFRFEPATYGGAPVKVEITFTHTFVPLPPPPPVAPGDQGVPRTAVLRGKLVELGTRLPVASATVIAVVGGHEYATDADPGGQFRLALPPGSASVTVHAPAHHAFVQVEALADRQELAVTYLIERDRYDPYEIVVVGNHARREEVSRIALRGPELQQVPGTFGDPFRVVQALPGVASVVSVLPFAVIRGASPSATGYQVDGTTVPLLYHLLAGPSVIHPEFIDEIQFYPGGAPASYGGYTGGIVDGRTVSAKRDQHLIDIDVNLLQAGGLVREPIEAIDATATVAARYGFPGFLLSLATDQATLSYWDYQLRLDGGTPANGWTVFAFGANDELDQVAASADPKAKNPPLTPSLILGFHRLDLRYHRTFGALETSARVVGGYDHTLAPTPEGGVGTDLAAWSVAPSLRARWKASEQLTVAGGIDGAARDVQQGSDVQAGASALSVITSQISSSYSGSGFAELLYRPTPDWLIRPGVRTDAYRDATATKAAIDPRLTVRYKLGQRDLPGEPPDSDDNAIWLKASAGIYHQPPRFILPLPGLDLLPLRYGLLKSYQTSVGAEIPLVERIQLSTEAFFNYLDPTVFDLSTNSSATGTGSNQSLIPTQVELGAPATAQYIDRLTTPQRGRSYGLEVLVRRQARSGLFGWISYSLSRSERSRDGSWVAYDYDRTHLVNLVAGLPLRHNWDLGLRIQYQSGPPATTTAGYNDGRADGYTRFDVRVDKRAVWNRWLLDFYVDVTNISLLPEEIFPGNTIRYVLPTAGVRGRF